MRRGHDVAEQILQLFLLRLRPLRRLLAVPARPAQSPARAPSGSCMGHAALSPTARHVTVEALKRGGVVHTLKVACVGTLPMGDKRCCIRTLLDHASLTPRWGNLCELWPTTKRLTEITRLVTEYACSCNLVRKQATTPDARPRDFEPNFQRGRRLPRHFQYNPQLLIPSPAVA